MKFIIKGQERDLYIEYKKKKNLSINLSPEGFITIRAPLGISDDQLRQAVESLIPRLEKKLDKLEENRKIYEAGSFNRDQNFKLFGKDYDLEDFDLKDKEDLRKFYRDKLSQVLDQLLKDYSKKMKLSYKSYRINEVKTTWGTCSSDGRLSFNLRLAMAPVDVIEYVVIHELSHRKHMNHDRSFWNHVGSYMKDYKDKENYLKAFGAFMTL
ncbi:MAG: SprT family zinc-dependent metalloprotease [Bacillota bacterium]|nr:SprT family zinc-dependent metalloprotease [Bacillota bacterium]